MSNPDNSSHPCFNEKVKGGCGRVHLPVAPKCNVLCNFCNRKFDCVNESRPGVASAVLSPVQAVTYLEKVMERMGNITVAGIAGPGDPMANAPKTLETMARVRKAFPDLLLCLSSNGLHLPEHVRELKRLGLTHVTITVSAVDPEVGKKIYAWVRDRKVVYRGLEGAGLIWSRQQEAISRLKENGMQVKVNSILVPGINDRHMPEIARTVAALGADLFNLIPVFPNPGTKFENITEPGRHEVDSLRETAGRYLPQMTHCQRCRADAVGLLDRDRSLEMAPLVRKIASQAACPDQSRPYVAAASREGMLVNQHLGEARSFDIWGQKEGSYELLEKRQASPPGGGPGRWRDLARILGDCRAVLVNAVGESPRQVLSSQGVQVVETDGLVEEVLEWIYQGKDVSRLKPAGAKGCCTGGLFGGCG
ncbi:radical SAM protein [Desulfonatronovibrio hydrogenovorans]|uniref:radical SAM protein n=1 Tax=Desulfonatronovibrio hydrogenovorans TaxID=53245 RepID=UPI00048DF7B9|nr:radical SAM protein [Desulfonatronovibrio hydrogenovorans]